MKRLLALALLVPLACGPSPHRTAVNVRAVTVPAGRATPGFDEQQREGATMRYAWQLSAPDDWKVYADQITAKLEAMGFRREAGTELLFTRSENSENHQLEIRRDGARVLVKLGITHTGQLG